ncbi:MAG: C4-type zinc ribbon domain-containing protein [Chloroflexota bacterium]
MTSIRELIRLQGFDTELAARRSVLEDIERQLSDSAELETLREEATAQGTGVREAEHAQRESEYEIETLSAQIATEEAKLYGGSVRSPKELAALDQEVTSLKTRRKQLEERGMAAMGLLEARRSEQAALDARLTEAQEERRNLEVKLGAQQAQAQAETAILNTQREGVAIRVPAADLENYNRLLVMKQGKAVARIERAVCQGCRINLPMTIQQRVRSNQVLVQCPSCQRLLYTDH